MKAFLQAVDRQPVRVLAKACSRCQKFLWPQGEAAQVLQDRWKLGELSERVSHILTSLSLSKKFAHDCYWQQDTDLDRHLVWINTDSLKRDAANKLSYKSKAGRAQQLVGFKSEHLTKNSGRLRENSIATSAASLLPVFLFFISTSTIHHLPNFFLHLIIVSILRCITQEDTYTKQHNIIIWFAVEPCYVRQKPSIGSVGSTRGVTVGNSHLI